MKKELIWVKNILKDEQIDIFNICKTSYSEVYQIISKKEVYFLKINHPNFSKESLVIEYLFQLFPKNNLNILASSKEFNCFLTSYAGETLETILSLNENYFLIFKAIEKFQYMQKNMDIKKLIELKIRNFELSQIIQLSQSLLNKVNLDIKNKIEKDVLFLLDNGIKDSLEHGDFHLGNILCNKNEIIFIDFAEATLTNPLFSLISFKNSLIYRAKCEQKIIFEVEQYYLESFNESSSIIKQEMYKKSHKLWYLYNIWCLTELLKTSPDLFYQNKIEEKIKRNYSELITSYNN